MKEKIKILVTTPKGVSHKMILEIPEKEKKQEFADRWVKINLCKTCTVKLL